MEDLIWLIPALPLAGFVLLVAFGRRLGEPLAGWLATAMVAASFVASIALFLSVRTRRRRAPRAPPDAVRVDARRAASR